MDLTQTETTYGSTDRTWLRSARGTTTTQEVTLDADEFPGALGLDDGRVLDGTLLGLRTADGIAGPYDAATPAVDGTEVFVGILLSPVSIVAGRQVGGAMMIEGTIDEANLPHAADAIGGVDDAARAHKDFQFIS